MLGNLSVHLQWVMGFQGPCGRDTAVMKWGSGYIYKTFLSMDLLIVTELLFGILMLPKFFPA